jgi:hypothetical protein
MKKRKKALYLCIAILLYIGGLTIFRAFMQSILFGLIATVCLICAIIPLIYTLYVAHKNNRLL